MRIGKYANAFARACRARMGEGERPSRAWSSKPLLTGAAVGGAVAYLLDPVQGRRRRHLLVDRVAAAARRKSRRGARAIRIALAQAEGHAKGGVHRLRPSAKEPQDDVTLVNKVKSVVFRDATFPKGQISINAEDGEVFLRGQVDRPELIHELEAAVRNVPGVRGVENLLHLPGTPTPTSHGEGDTG